MFLILIGVFLNSIIGRQYSSINFCLSILVIATFTIYVMKFKVFFVSGRIWFFKLDNK